MLGFIPGTTSSATPTPISIGLLFRMRSAASALAASTSTRVLRAMRSSAAIMRASPPAGGFQRTWMAGAPHSRRFSANDSSPRLTTDSSDANRSVTGFTPLTAHLPRSPRPFP